MKIFLLTLISIVLLSCNSKPDNRKVDENNSKELKIIPDFSVALKFINDYAEYCSPENHDSSDSTWIQNNPLLTNSFKSRYKTILDSAQKVDPELGLDFDPIFDAQDFPDKGFSILKADTSSGYITVHGIDWEKFELVLKVVDIDNKWQVDGAGIINIPRDKRARKIN
jgi:hypothetical protein